MKKRFASVLILVAVLALVALFFVSCGDTPEYTPSPPSNELTGDALVLDLLGKSDDKMEALTSYKTDYRSELKFETVSGTVEITSDEEEWLTGIDTKSFQTLSVTTVGGTIDGKKTGETVTTEAYYNGYFYIAEEDLETGDKKVLRSPVARSEYEEYLEGEEDGFDFDDDLFLAANKKLAEKQEDGSWHIELSGYSNAAVLRFAKLFSSFGTFLQRGVLFSDVKFECALNSDFSVKSVSFEFEFSSSDASVPVPEFFVAVTFSDYNAIDSVNFDLSDSEATEVLGLLDVLRVNSALSKTIEKEKLSFEADLTTDIAGTVNSQRLEFLKEDIYGGGLSYTYTYTQNTATRVISYAGGKTYIDNTETGIPTDDVTERLSLSSIYNFGTAFDIYGVEFVDVSAIDGNTVYTVTVDPDYDTNLNDIVSSLNCSLKNELVVFKFTVKDGYITKLEYESSADIQYRGSVYPTEIVMTVEYNINI